MAEPTLEEMRATLKGGPTGEPSIEEMRAALKGETAAKPEEIIQEQHPNFSYFKERLPIESLGGDRALTVLQNAHPDMQIKMGPDNQIIAKTPDEKQWRTLAPNVDSQSILHPVEMAKKFGDMALPTAMGLAASTAGAGAGLGATALTGLGGLPVGMAVGAGSAAGLDYLRQKAAQEIGLQSPDTDKTSMAVAGGLGGLAPAAFGLGPAKGEIAALLQKYPQIAEKVLANSGTLEKLANPMAHAAEQLYQSTRGISKYAPDAIQNGAAAVKDAVTSGAGWVGKKAARILGNVDEANLEKYMANPDRVNEAGKMSHADIKDIIDQGVSGVTSDRDLLAQRAQNSADQLESAYSNKKQELIGQVTPLDRAKELSASLGAQKNYLHELSGKADQALDDSGVMYKKSDLLGAIDKIGHGAGDAISDEATAALGKLQTTRDRIAAQLPDEIDSVRLRKALQQIRKDIDFDLGNGEFNTTLNGMRKTFTKNISDTLKNDSPEYAQYMGKMSEISDSLGKMNRYFGDEGKSLGSLETLRKGGTQSQVIEDVLKEHARLTKDTSLLDRVNSLRSNQTTLGEMKKRDIKDKLFPDLYNLAQEHAADAQMGQDISGNVERLRGNRTYGVAKSGIKDNNASFMDRQALENLKNSTGQNYNQLLEDKAVHDSFSKDGTRGSRMTVLGATLGGSLGHTLFGPMGGGMGAAAGASAGATVDKYGGQMVKGAVDASLKAKNALDANVILNLLRGGYKQTPIGEFLRSQAAPSAGRIINAAPVSAWEMMKGGK